MLDIVEYVSMLRKTLPCAQVEREELRNIQFTFTPLSMLALQSEEKWVAWP